MRNYLFVIIQANSEKLIAIEKLGEFLNDQGQKKIKG